LKSGFIEKIFRITGEIKGLREGIYKAVSGEGTYYEIIKNIFSLETILKTMKAIIK